MSFELLVRVIAMVSVVFAAAWATTASMGRWSAASRHAVWSAALVVALVLPAAALYGPVWELPVLAPPAGEEGVVGEASLGSVSIDLAPVPGRRTVGEAAVRDLTPESAPVAGTPAVAAAAETSARVSPAMALAAVWLAGLMVCIGRLLAGLAWTWWTVRQARHVTRPDWVADLAGTSARLGLRSPVTMLASARATTPSVHGLWRSRLVLPPQAQAWVPERRRVVLLHELAHVLRRDAAVQVLARLAVAVHWFNPLAHLAVRRLRLEQERACDDVVLAGGSTGTEYADHLVEIAQACRPSVAGADGWVTVGMARPSQLETRLRAILDAGADRRGLSLRSRALLVACVATVALPLATLRLTATEAGATDLRRPGPATAEVTRQEAESVSSAVIGIDRVEGGAAPQDARAVTAVQPAPVPAAQADAPRTVVLANDVEPWVIDHDVFVYSHPAQTETPADPQTAAARERAADALADALDDGDEGVRRAARQSLAALRDPRVVPVLVAELDSDDESIRRQAVSQLGMFDTSEAVQGLLRATRDADEPVRLAALLSLARIAGAERSVPALTAALQDESPQVRRQAVRLLGRHASADVVEALTTALGDADPQVREEAARALGRIASGRVYVTVGSARVDQLEREVAALRERYYSAGHPELQEALQQLEQARYSAELEQLSLQSDGSVEEWDRYVRETQRALRLLAEETGGFAITTLEPLPTTPEPAPTTPEPAPTRPEPPSTAGPEPVR